MTERGQRTGDEFGSLFEELSLEQFREAVHSLFFLSTNLGVRWGFQSPAILYLTTAYSKIFEEALSRNGDFLDM